MQIRIHLLAAAIICLSSFASAQSADVDFTLGDDEDLEQTETVVYGGDSSDSRSVVLSCKGDDCDSVTSIDLVTGTPGNVACGRRTEFTLLLDFSIDVYYDVPTAYDRDEDTNLPCNIGKYNTFVDYRVNEPENSPTTGTDESVGSIRVLPKSMTQYHGPYWIIYGDADGDRHIHNNFLTKDPNAAEFSGLKNGDIAVAETDPDTNSGSFQTHKYGIEIANDYVVEYEEAGSLASKLGYTADSGTGATDKWMNEVNLREDPRNNRRYNAEDSTSATPVNARTYQPRGELIYGDYINRDGNLGQKDHWWICTDNQDGTTIINGSETGAKPNWRCDAKDGGEEISWRTDNKNTWEPVRVCEDGIDNDGDGSRDHPDAGTPDADDGCVSPDDTREEGECEEGLSNRVWYYKDATVPERFENEDEGGPIAEDADDPDAYGDDVAVWYTENSSGNCQTNWETGDEYADQGGSSTSFSGENNFKGSYGFVPPRDTSWYPGAPIPDKAEKVDCSRYNPPRSGKTDFVGSYYERGNWYSKGSRIGFACGNNDNAYAVFNGTSTGNIASLYEGFKREANEEARPSGAHVQRLADASQEFANTENQVCGENSKGIPVNEEGITGQNCYYDPSPPQGWKALNQDENPIQPETKGYGDIPSSTVGFLEAGEDKFSYEDKVDIFFETNFTIPTYQARTYLEGSRTDKRANWDGGWVPQCPPTYQLSYDTSLGIWKCTSTERSVTLSVEKANIVNADSGETYGGLKITNSEFSSAWNDLTGSNPFERPGEIRVDTVCHRGNPSDYDNAATNSNTDHMIKTMEGSVEEIKLVTNNLPELESKPNAAGYSCRFAFLKNYSNTDTAYAIEGLDGDGRLETNVPGSFDFDVSSNNPPVGNDNKFTYFSDSNARFARNLYEKTDQNPFRINCENVDGRYQRLCETTVGT